MGTGLEQAEIGIRTSQGWDRVRTSRDGDRVRTSRDGTGLEQVGMGQG